MTLSSLARLAWLCGSQCPSTGHSLGPLSRPPVKVWGADGQAKERLPGMTRLLTLQGPGDDRVLCEAVIICLLRQGDLASLPRLSVCSHYRSARTSRGSTKASRSRCRIRWSRSRRAVIISVAPCRRLSWSAWLFGASSPGVVDGYGSRMGLLSFRLACNIGDDLGCVCAVPCAVRDHPYLGAQT